MRCRTSHPQLSIAKTTEMLIDFSRSSPFLLVSIRGLKVDVVSTTKHLGLHLDNKINWSLSTDAS